MYGVYYLKTAFDYLFTAHSRVSPAITPGAVNEFRHCPFSESSAAASSCKYGVYYTETVFNFLFIALTESSARGAAAVMQRVGQSTPCSTTKNIVQLIF